GAALRRAARAVALRRATRAVPWGILRVVRAAVLAGLGVALVAAGVVPVASVGREAAEVIDRALPDRFLERLAEPLRLRRLPERSSIYAADGTLLQHLYWGYDREWVPLRRIRPLTRRAVLAIEDARFYEHGAVDLRAILRALVANLEAGGIVQGGSTISQQVVRMSGVGDEPTLRRKLAEAWAAFRLERTFTKDEILERYLNQVYLGHGVYGLAAASEFYFGLPVRRLGLARSALLAGMIAGPSEFDPIRHPRRALARRNVVLGRMLELGWITEPRYRRAVRAPLGLSAARRGSSAHGPTSFWTQYVIRTFLSDPRFGDTFRERRRRLFRGGLEIHTTLDPRLQAIAEEVLRERMTGPGLPQSALVAVDPRTGAILAMANGNWPFGRRRYDLASAPGGGRSAGSAFKVFTLAAALLEGIPPTRVYDGSSPKTIPDCGGGETWTLRNAEPGSGSYTLASATAHSVNTVFAQVIDEVGPADVARVAHRMGIDSPLVPVCPLTLGTSAVSPLEMASAVGTLANRGIHCEPYAIARIVNREGRTVYRAEPECRRAIPAWVASLETSLLEGVIRAGTGTAADIGRPAAGKTGTAQDYADAWFVGYVPQLAAAVWVGYARAEIPMPYVPGHGPGFGGVLAAPIWHDFMLRATVGLPARDFAQVPRPSPTPTPTPSPTPSPTSSPSP
ncbi:MAG TPA: transglycosylase domain-containing protein, partial [Actinomycetota bacterium]|nr:transglycosylase domain-containing protein [Actinomycetota bacterium]